MSRAYFNHRFSDDLDLFVNNNDNYHSLVGTLFHLLEASEKQGSFRINREYIRKSEHFTQLLLEKEHSGETVNLKIDLVNDTARHYGEFLQHETMGRVDSMRNILSNKIAAVFRYEAKDLADLLFLARNMRFSWRDVFREALSKEAGADPVAIYNILKSAPADLFDTLKWIDVPDPVALFSDLARMADDLFKGGENSLFAEKPRTM
ncbi:MAG: nucleotidyl transferase AbiEii/AbiGii toxin family protein [Candidatus Wallbacteria bacterium]|nr:nucleotidyl transferase AbiEii/AbiGii toxin family protein [Candidatus Wallbacteria bacterium]